MNVSWDTAAGGTPPPMWTPKPPKRNSSSLKVLFAIVAAVTAFVGMIVLLAAIGSSHRNDARYDPPTNSVAPPGPSIETHAPAVVDTPTGPVSVITEGQFEVGVDVVPGKYRTQGPQPGALDMCYVERSRNDSGELGSIIANDIVHGPQTITVKAGEFVKNTGCMNFEKIG